MQYEEFKQLLVDKIAMSVPFDTTVSLKTIRKNNGVVFDAVSISGPGDSISPTFCLKGYYEQYRNGISPDFITKEILREQSGFRRSGISADKIVSGLDVKERVRFKIVNYDMNALQLREIPHLKILDLAMVFYCKVDEGILPDANILLRRDMLERNGIREDELKELSVRNTEKEYPPVLEKISSMLGFGAQTGSACEEDDDELYVLTNRKGVFGAAALFYPETGALLRKKIGGKLFLLPSSVHEWIILPGNETTKIRELNELICEVNEMMVSQEEVLGSHAYLFDCETMNLGFLSY
ncbi:MAG: hypothetical protein IJJ50_06055 [Lachnospiraceae bacterium]|nr:hypothetical protein [Lachnospiraceae bacterium]